MSQVKSIASLYVRSLGRTDYETAWRAMRAFTDARSAQTVDEIWLVEHAPVYTMGLKGRGGSVRAIGGIPVVYTDRGGDMTYHGPGQLMLYVLLDLRRRGLGIKTLVHTLEQAVLDYLAQQGVAGARRAGAPGIYVDGKKIAALGLRIRGACSYHGLALNLNMDLSPFARIDPCGYEGLEVTQLADFHVATTLAVAGSALAERLVALLGYNAPVHVLPSDLTNLQPYRHE